jgi:5-methylcytosine-specific restriction protein B
VPNNIYVIGTMNTADKSISLVDIALRRRFHFVAYNTNYSLLRNVADVDTREMLLTINRRIELLADKDHQIGHAFFLRLNSLLELAETFRDKIIPLLFEYFYNDSDKVAKVLGSDTRWNANEELHIMKRNTGGSEQKFVLQNNLEFDDAGSKSVYETRREIISLEEHSIKPEWFKCIYTKNYETQTPDQMTKSDTTILAEAAGEGQ